MNRKATKLEARFDTALHEAGHGVAAIVLGARLVYLTTVRSNSWGGCAFIDMDEVSLPAPLVDAITSLAGPEASRRFASLRGFRFVDKTTPDILSAQRACRYYPNPTEAMAAFDRLQKQAASLVERHWDKIERVGLELLRESVLSGDRVVELMFSERKFTWTVDQEIAQLESRVG